MKKVPIVAIGASAGGIKAYQGLFEGMPANLNAAFVIVQHLDPHHKSILSDIIGRYTDMEVRQISNGMEVKPGHVYIIPPNRQLSLQDNQLILHPQDQLPGSRMQIDHFLNSLKDELKDQTIAIILSGTGSDGSAGVRAVKEEDALVIAQSPKEAQYDGMPQSAIKTGVVDYVASVSEIPEIIENYIGSAFTNTEENRLSFEGSKGNFTKILKLIQKRSGHDFSSYKKATIVRRIERRIALNKLSDLDEYLEFLQGNPEEQDALYRSFLIRVTNFFRDEEAFETLKKEVVPELLNENKKEVRVWVPACATGEEAYSIAMLFAERIEQEGLKDTEVQIFASDIDQESISIARKGSYSESLVSAVPQELRSAYFSRESGAYKVKRWVRDMVIFAEQNINQDPPYSRLDLISCRNLLIYLDSDLQQKIFPSFYKSLRKDGYLFLGTSETLGKCSVFFDVVSRKDKIFRKKSELSQLTRDSMQEIWVPPAAALQEERKPLEDKEEATPYGQIARSLTLKRYTPPSVIINASGDILYFQGRTSEFLEHPEGTPTFNVFQSCREGLKVPMTNAVIKAEKSGHEVTDKNIRVKTNGGYSLVDIVVFPVERAERRLLMVVFKKVRQLKVESSDSENESEKVKRLKKELEENQQYLQNTIEELETSNEELKSANEEAQSSNEELQSTNEELETSKEELQSVNEELETTNQELQIKNDELIEANNDINNLLSSTAIGTVFLDKKLRIFRFTPAIKDIMDLIKADIGRPISQFKSYLKYDKMAEDATEVIETLIPKELQVESHDDRFFWMRVLPYRTITDEISGAVITFTDITENKRTQDELEIYKKHLEKLVEERTEELRKANYRLKKEMSDKEKTMRALKQKEESFRTLVENSQDVIVRLDKDLKHVYVNPAVEDQTEYSREDYIGKTNRDLGMPTQLVDNWEQYMKQCFNTGKTLAFEFEYQTPAGPKIFHSVLIPEYNDTGEVETVLGTSRLIEHRKEPKG